jgi:O-antigen/teichoic acid export membrane protein
VSAVRRNLVWLFAAQLATWSVSIVVLVLAPDRLEAVGYGQLGLATAFVGFFTLIGSLGTSGFIARHVARDHDSISGLVVAGVRLKLIVGPLMSFVAILLAWLLGYSDDTIVLIALGCVGMIALLLNEIVVAGLHGMERMARAAFWQTVQVYAGTAAGIAVLLTTQSVVAYSACFVAASFIPLVANYITIRPYLRRAATSQHTTWRPMILGGIPLMVLSVLNLVYSTIDIPILEGVAGTETVGWYTLAYKWIGMPMFAATIVITALFPQMSASFATDRAKFAQLTNRAIRAVAFVIVPASIGLIFVAQDLLTLLYQSKYDNSVVLMQILSIHIPIAALDSILATALIASNRQNRYVVVAGVAAAFNPPLVYLAVRITDERYANGGIGAAVLTVATETFILACAIRLRSAGVLDRSTMWFCARVLLAAAVMSATLILLADQPLIVKIAIGGVAYAGGSLAFRLTSPRELRTVFDEQRAARGGISGPPDQEGNDEMSDSGATQ